MKKFSFLVLAALMMTGCWTSIRTVAPVAEYVAPVKTVYSTTVTTPTPKHTTVTTITVTNFNTDMSFYLDLNAVAAAFAESKNVREFEQLLNSSRYMINNLDLNNDGWVDYLRVIETHKGSYHTMLIQACLAPSVFQDVATLIAEHRPNALLTAGCMARIISCALSLSSVRLCGMCSRIRRTQCGLRRTTTVIGRITTPSRNPSI